MDHFARLKAMVDGRLTLDGTPGTAVVNTENEHATLTCPTCKGGTLEVEGLSFLACNALNQDGERLSSHSSEPVLASLLLRCPTGGPVGCSPVALIAEGQLDVDPFAVPYEMDKLVLWFEVKAMEPSYSLIEAKKHISNSIQELGRKAGALLWVDAEAAANKLRIAIETFLDEIGVPAYNNKGKPLYLHSRIEEGQDTKKYQHDQIENLLMAMKILGNDGSHSRGVVTTDNVIQAGRMLTAALRLQFQDPEDEALISLAESWVENKKTD